MSNENITLTAQVSRELFYNAESMFGVFSFYPVDNRDKIQLNTYGNFVVNGNCPPLSVNKEYEIEIVPSTHPRYGDGYTFVVVKTPRPTTIEEQQEYVKTVITESQYEAILAVYPNDPLLDLIENRELDCTHIKGIKEKTLETIREKLLNNMEVNQLLVELKDFNLTTNAIHRLLKHFGGVEMVLEAIKTNIYNLCDVDGFGFKTVDGYALARGDKRENPNRIRYAILYTLDQDANNGDSWMHVIDAKNNSTKLLGIDENYIIDGIEKLSMEENSPIHIYKSRIGLKRNYFYEEEIYKKLIEMVSEESVFSPFSDEHIVESIEEQQKITGFEYSKDQKEAIYHSARNNVLVINGRAGSGKSTVIKGIIDLLDNYTYNSCALSGKAVRVLVQNELHASTIHRMLGFDPETGGFKHNRSKPLPYDIVIIDESSMVNSYLMYSVIVALKEGAKLLFVGDAGQLPPIGVGAIFDDLINSDIVKKQELVTIHRQAAKSGILEVANKIRDGQQVVDDGDYETKVFGELRDMVVIPTKKETDIKQMVIDISKRNLDKDVMDYQVITGRTNAGSISVESLNKELQKVFNDLDKPFIKRGAYEYREGDKVIQNGNNYGAKIEIDYNSSEHFVTGEDGELEEKKVDIFNGSVGKIVKIEFDDNRSRSNHKVFINFVDVDETVVYSTKDMGQVGLAYAISTHKSQGDNIKNVVFAFNFESYMLLSKEFVYTGITRASKGCIMIAELDALRHAIRNTQGSTRRTYLKEMSEGTEFSNNIEG